MRTEGQVGSYLPQIGLLPFPQMTEEEDICDMIKERNIIIIYKSSMARYDQVLIDSLIRYDFDFMAISRKRASEFLAGFADMPIIMFNGDIITFYELFRHDRVWIFDSYKLDEKMFIEWIEKRAKRET
jgi:hypothetical protein